jgi:hypothetical protein
MWLLSCQEWLIELLFGYNEEIAGGRVTGIV